MNSVFASTYESCSNTTTESYFIRRQPPIHHAFLLSGRIMTSSNTSTEKPKLGNNGKLTDDQKDALIVGYF